MAKSPSTSHSATRIGHMVKVSNGNNWKPASAGTQSGAKSSPMNDSKSGC